MEGLPFVCLKGDKTRYYPLVAFFKEVFVMMLGGEWFADDKNEQTRRDSLFDYINKLRVFILEKERIPYSDRVLVSVSEFLQILSEVEKAAEEREDQ